MKKQRPNGLGNGDPKALAESHLVNIELGLHMIEEKHNEAKAEVDLIAAKYKIEIDRWRKDVALHEKALEKLVKNHRAEILAGGDRADLPSGSVMLKVEKRVKQIKGMLEKLKAFGLAFAIKSAKEVVNWDVVNRMDDATLKSLGTERVEAEMFSYELKR
jgi:phage host-nuclease inhibitor protein Gam